MNETADILGVTCYCSTTQPALTDALSGIWTLCNSSSRNQDMASEEGGVQTWLIKLHLPAENELLKESASITEKMKHTHLFCSGVCELRSVWTMLVLKLLGVHQCLPLLTSSWTFQKMGYIFIHLHPPHTGSPWAWHLKSSQRKAFSGVSPASFRWAEGQGKGREEKCKEPDFLRASLTV